MEKEMPYTKGAVKNSEIMLKGLIKTVEEDKEIGLVVLLGDIVNEHESPKTVETKRLWEDSFNTIRTIVNSRHADMPELTVWNRDGSIKKGANRLMTIKGNHDFKNNDKWRKERTYFDELVSRGFFEYPDAVMFEDNGKQYYYHFRSFGEADKTLGEEYKDAYKTVAFAHDWFYGEGLPEQYQYWAGFGRTIYELSSVVSGVDVFIQGHSHSRYEPFLLKGLADKVRQHPQKSETVFYITGTNARTPIAPDMMRDFGYNLILDTSQGLGVTEFKLGLMPYEEYFIMDYKK